MRILPYIFLGCLLVFASCSEDRNVPVGAGNQPAGDQPTFSKSEAPVDLTDRYIVVFKESVRNPHAMTDELIKAHGGTLHYRYRAALKGFAATLPPQALEGIRHNPNVDYIEADGVVSINAVQTNPPSWGLDRIDQRNRPLDASYTYQNSGDGVTIYIIDTGIRFDHQEFGNRASSGYDFVDNDADASDCQGHGTHVAGTAAGTTVGVAKGANLVAVRVLNCSGSGSYSGVIAGVDWVTINAVKPAVANMSLGGGLSTSLNSAVNNSVSSGVVYAVAAGNSNANACNYSPASAASALTVGATTSSDARSSFSNFGSCVDIFAPGSSIYSSTMTSTSSYASWSGTSMASPHVAGVAALYLSSSPNATPAQVENAIKTNATSGVLTSIGTGSPNLLLYSLIAATAPVNPPDAPSNLSANSVSTSQINLNWTDNSSNETGFKIERSTNGTSFSQIATVGANTTSYSSTGLASGTQYWFRVRSYNDGGNSSYSNVANATTQSPPSLHLADLTGSSSSQGNKWTATVTVTVHDQNHNPAQGATVTVKWSNGASGSISAVTDANGQCTISKANISNNKSSATATVNKITKSGFSYLSGNNHVSTSLVIARP